MNILATYSEKLRVIISETVYFVSRRVVKLHISVLSWVNVVHFAMDICKQKETPLCEIKLREEKVYSESLSGTASQPDR